MSKVNKILTKLNKGHCVIYEDNKVILYHGLDFGIAKFLARGTDWPFKTLASFERLSVNHDIYVIEPKDKTIKRACICIGTSTHSFTFSSEKSPALTYERLRDARMNVGIFLHVSSIDIFKIARLIESVEFLSAVGSNDSWFELSKTLLSVPEKSIQKILTNQANMHWPTRFKLEAFQIDNED